jgi:hypothetical protein
LEDPEGEAGIVVGGDAGGDGSIVIPTTPAVYLELELCKHFASIFYASILRLRTIHFMNLMVEKVSFRQGDELPLHDME